MILKIEKITTVLCACMLISSILVVFAVPYTSAKNLEDTFTDDYGNGHSVWVEIPTNETYYQVYYSNNVSGNNISIGEKITNSSVNITYPKIAIDSSSDYGYLLWYNESGQNFCYCGTNEILNKTPENITWGGVRYISTGDTIQDNTLNVTASNYTLTLTWKNSTGTNKNLTIYPDIDGDGLDDIEDDGHIWSIILCGPEETTSIPDIALNEAACQMYNILLGHEYVLTSGNKTTHQRNDMYLIMQNTTNDVDKNGNYTDDVDIQTNKTNLKNAISSENTGSWFLDSAGDGYRVDCDDIVYIYMASHGNKNTSNMGSYVKIDNDDDINSNEINYWLNIMEEKTNVSKVCLVVEACYSGGFIGTLGNFGASQSNNTENTQRIVITCTIRETPSSPYHDYNDANKSLGGAFSAPFANSLDSGKSIGDAFINAEKFAEGYSNYLLTKAITYDHQWDDLYSDKPFLPQNPKLDDNGDGIGCNGNDLCDTDGKDGAIANSLFLTCSERRNASEESAFISYGDLNDTLHDYARRHPYLMSIENIGYSSSNSTYNISSQPTWAVKLSDNPDIDQEELEILIVGSIHGNEKMGTEFSMAFIQYIIDNYFIDENVTNLVNNRELYIIPVYNPYGYVNNSRRNGNGVDLNRDFWYPNCTNATFTENETQSFQSFISNHNFSTSLFLHGYWSPNGSVLHPYHYSKNTTGANCTYDDVVNTTANDLGAILEVDDIGTFWQFSENYTPASDPFRAKGNSDDWLYNNHSCIALTAECYSPSLSDFYEQWMRHLDAFEYLINISTVSYLSPESEEIICGNYNLSWVVNDNTLKTRTNYTISLEYGKMYSYTPPPSLTWFQIISLDNTSSHYLWNTTSLHDGTYYLRIRLIDNSSNLSISEDCKLITILNGEWKDNHHVKVVYEGSNLLSPSGQDVKNASDYLNLKNTEWQCLSSIGYRDSSTNHTIKWRKALANGSQEGDDFELEAGVAYWFNFTDMVLDHFDIHFAGPEIEESISLYLKTGQSNYVSFPYPTDTYTSYDLLDLIQNCTNISKWNSIEQEWVTASKNISGKSGSNYSIELGEGYNVTVDEDVIWPPPESPSFIWANKSNNDVRLEWSDGKGIFEIFISNNLNGTGFNFSSPNASTSNRYWSNRYWVHEDALGDGDNYSYVVRAKENTTNSNIAWKFAKEISKPGFPNVTWASLPYAYEMATLEDVAEDIGDDIAWKVRVYDTSNQEYKSVEYNTSTSSWEGNTSYAIDFGGAVQIYCNNSGTWDIVGSYEPIFSHSIAKPGNPNINWLAIPFHHSYDNLEDIAIDIGDAITWEVRVWSVTNQAYNIVIYDDLFLEWIGYTSYALSEGDVIMLFCRNTGDWQPDVNNP